MSKLNEKEQTAMDLTVQLWSALVALDTEHPDDIHEHRRDIHSIQNRIAARPTLRVMNDSNDSPIPDVDPSRLDKIQIS